MIEGKELLQPCPFCGSGQHEADRNCLKILPDSQNFYYVVCWCGTRGPLRDSKRDAVQAWNTRDASERRAVWNPFASATEVIALDFKGNLRSISIPTLLQILSSDNKSGILQVINGKKRRAICLKQGKIIAGSGQPGLQLGQILYQKGLISAELLLRVLDEAKKSGKRVGEMLLALGYINEDTLKELIHHQIRQVVFDLLHWTEGDFLYQDCLVEFDNTVVEDLNAIQLVLESAVMKDEWAATG
jgi:Lar family restriction alleviation protein